MKRADMRRKQREEQKAKTATYCYTKADLDRAVQKTIGDKIAEAKQEAMDDAVNAAMVLLLTLPLEVLMDYYWPKTYKKKIPEFTAHVLDYYDMWQDGKLDIDKLIEDLWEYAGIRLEESE